MSLSKISGSHVTAKTMHGGGKEERSAATEIGVEAQNFPPGLRHILPGREGRKWQRVLC